MKISVITALDHFNTREDKKCCHITAIGEIVDENKDYVYLRTMHIYFPDGDNDPTIEVKGIVKSTIIVRKDLEVKLEQ